MKRWHRIAAFVVIDLALFGLVGTGAALLAALAYGCLEVWIAERREVARANRLVRQVAVLELDRGRSEPVTLRQSRLSDRMHAG